MAAAVATNEGATVALLLAEEDVAHIGDKHRWDGSVLLPLRVRGLLIFRAFLPLLPQEPTVRPLRSIPPLLQRCPPPHELGSRLFSRRSYRCGTLATGAVPPSAAAAAKAMEFLGAPPAVAAGAPPGEGLAPPL